MCLDSFSFPRVSSAIRNRGEFAFGQVNREHG
jgi:hypothetical protein